MYLNVNPSNLLKEVLSMLYWSMLAACTVGPGTVVTCARAGAEFELNLIYVLIFASCLAYTLQEGTARLTINSGLSLGQCLRRKFEHTYKIYNSALICWVVAICVTVGNTLYECNNFAGGIDAVMSFPGADELVRNATESHLGPTAAETGLRVGSCFAYAIVVLTLLYKDKTDILGVCLGVIMMGMVTLFLIVVGAMGVDWEKFAWGLLPNYPQKGEDPDSVEPADIIISLVGTTSIGFNLFLGGAMAKGRTLGSAQRGIAFSTISAFVVSVLILTVGAGYHKEKTDSNFSVTDLAKFIQQFVGVIGVSIYSVGFIAAALSSMLTVPLGAALTADSVFSDDVNEANDAEADGDDTERPGDAYAVTSDKIPVPTSPSKVPMSPSKSEVNIPISPPTSPEKKLLSLSPQSLHIEQEQQQAGAQDMVTISGDLQPSSSQPAELGLTIENVTEEPSKLPRWIYLSIMFVMVIISLIVISANADRTYVILVAQVFNGCLLPFFSTCLLLCLNDQQFMKASPQPLWANIFLVTSVLITMFLANNALMQKIFGDMLQDISIRLAVAVAAAFVEMFLVSVLTSLGKDIWRSFRESKLSLLCFVETNNTEEERRGDLKLSKV